MANLIAVAESQARQLLTTAFHAAIQKGLLPQGEVPPFTIEIPADTSHGDFASNAAMVSARAFKSAPRKIAEAVCESLDLSATFFDRWEIAGPGFINLFLKDLWFTQTIDFVLEEREAYGSSNYGNGEKVMIEFVSANPTGPMHMGNARGGALGDCLADAMSCAGYKVTKEFYVNDAGNQVAKFGKSLEARYLQLHLGEDAVEFPEDGYHGDDIRERAQEFTQIHGDAYVKASPEERQKALVDYALPKNIKKMKDDLGKYRIVYDVWFLESTLHESGAVQAAIDALSQKGMTYEKDGTIWYKASSFGAEKDEVLVRSNGIPTYFAADIAYHYNKFAVRGFDRVINVWGADHHGHVARLKGAMDAIGLDGSKLDILLMQMVRLMRGGEAVRMSKRSGKAITLTNLIDEVPVDAARFFFNMREPNSTLDFDLDLAVEQSSSNPVYYVQYAHARICSILKNLAAEGIAFNRNKAKLELLRTVEERELIRLLARYPQEIIEAARGYDPARITRYTLDLATLFHKFYNSCRVRGEEEGLMQARLALCLAARITLRNALRLLKITAPEVM